MRNPTSSFGDYMSDMFTTTLSDHDIERLLSGQSPEGSGFDELTPFVVALRSFRSTTPPTDLEELL